MFFIPAAIPNLMMIAAAFMAAFQHSRLQFRNPVTNVQFAVMAMTPVLILAVALYNRVSPYLSVAFLLIAIWALLTIVRQQRMMPRRKLND